MLHLSNKGSKKSYAAKAACFAAGLVAVFASSSVLAENGLLLCNAAPDLKDRVSNVVDLGLTQPRFVVRVISIGGAAGERREHLIDANGPKGTIHITASMINGCTFDNTPVDVVQAVANDNAVKVGDGSFVVRAFDLRE